MFKAEILADSLSPHWCRNFKGFIQYRHLVENESK